MGTLMTAATRNFDASRRISIRCLNPSDNPTTSTSIDLRRQPIQSVVITFSLL
jgi:hypothetical protein